MKRNAVIRRVLAAAVVVGVSAGCSVSGPAGSAPSKPAAKPSKPADDKPSSTPSGKEEPKGPEAQSAVLSPGDKGKKVRELQARLRQVAWLFEYPDGVYGDSTVKAVKGFQGKRGLPKTGEVDPVTWKKLLGMTSKPGHFELYAGGDQPAAKPDPRCLKGRVLCISKTSRTLVWMIDGKAELTVDVRFGSEMTPTREGVFKVDFKSRNHHSTLYDTPMPYAMFFSRGQAVHYSSDFKARGYTGASHGCVNVRDEAKIASLFEQVKAGDKVVVYW
ncbi:L,D-transpeptidase family protein [Streptomyces sp. NPDC050418]|uniref:L,D-transpeptidase family protein n=1 Tax=Streptomyces sp. NPDC050418 TaxID=3365612 RepID=UPI003792A7CB